MTGVRNSKEKKAFGGTEWTASRYVIIAWTAGALKECALTVWIHKGKPNSYSAISKEKE